MQLNQITKNTFEDPSGIIHVINTKVQSESWLRDHYCVDCKVIHRVNAATFTIGERCPKCWVKHSVKSFKAETQQNAAMIYAALKAQVAQ